ncbi:MAG: methyltransferase domain-containing protein [Bacteroidetes bacterium]|nr:methyltransferase domain-containing protein [Bacteroidota bacterium]
MKNSKSTKIEQILACPSCKLQLNKIEKYYLCENCSLKFPYDSIPNLLIHNEMIKISDHYQSMEKSIKERIKNFIPLPDVRLWTRRSKNIICRTLKDINPDDKNKVVINIGSASERIFKKFFKPYDQIIKIGIPHKEHVDIFGDAMKLPIKNNCLDLMISSSVMEHIPDPELAVVESLRVLKPGGKIYCEIPFMVGYHMIPYDYQRYTIQGIERLFAKHGYKLIDKGISSGPFTAYMLMIHHSVINIAPKGFLQYVLRIILSWLLLPFKYLDYFVENSKWAEIFACNFYYLGEKPID